MPLDRTVSCKTVNHHHEPITSTTTTLKKADARKVALDTAAGLRLRIPSHYAYLFENGFEEYNNGNGENNGGKLLFIDLWVEDGILCMSYKPDKEYNHYENKPSFKTPRYGKGIGFCPKCQRGYHVKYYPKCPIHKTKNKNEKKDKTA